MGIDCTQYYTGTGLGHSHYKGPVSMIGNDIGVIKDYVAIIQDSAKMNKICYRSAQIMISGSVLGRIVILEQT